MLDNEELDEQSSSTEKLIRRFEAIIRLYKYVVDNPKHFDRNFHLREIDYALKAINQFKEEVKNENSDN